MKDVVWEGSLWQALRCETGIVHLPNINDGNRRQPKREQAGNGNFSPPVDLMKDTPFSGEDAYSEWRSWEHTGESVETLKRGSDMVFSSGRGLASLAIS